MQLGCHLPRTMILLRMACSRSVSASLPVSPKPTGACDAAAAGASACPPAELLLLVKVLNCVTRVEPKNLEPGAFCPCC